MLLCSFLLGSCDTHVIDVEQQEQQGLTFTRIPAGGSLLSTLGKSAQDAVHGCYVSSPNVGAPEIERYLYEGFYLHFPQDVLSAAGGRKRVVTGSTSLYAASERSVPAVVRVVRCIIPDVEAAEELLVNQALRFPTRIGAVWEGEAMEGVPVSAGKASSCTTYWVERTVCDGGPGEGEAIAKQASSCHTVLEPHTFCGGGSGGGTGDPGGDGGIGAPGGGGGSWGGGPGGTPEVCAGIVPGDAEALGCYPDGMTTEQYLSLRLEQDPYLLMEDVPCSKLPEW